MIAIKVGNERVMLSNVTNVTERMSDFLQVMSDGSIGENYYGKPEDTHRGLVVMVYFVTGRDDSDYVKFCEKEAELFLQKFDALTQIKPNQNEESDNEQF
jgi:hypothetical protein